MVIFVTPNFFMNKSLLSIFAPISPTSQAQTDRQLVTFAQPVMKTYETFNILFIV